MSHTLAPSALHRLWLGLISYSVVFALLQTRLLKPLGLPEGEEVLMLLDLGYAAEGAGPLPMHHQRKPLSETVTNL